MTHDPAPPPTRPAIDQMRRQAELLLQQAAAARHAAEVARQQAKDANLAAKAAEQSAGVFKDAAHTQEAKRLRQTATSEDLGARKAEARADLLEARQREQAGRVRDAEEGRGADRPSQTTLAAQDDVKQKRFAASLLEPPPPGQPDPLDGAGANTDALLKRAQDAAGPVFDAQAHGRKPTQKQLGYLNETLGDWLEGAAHEMRVAGVEAQARGEDPVAAMQEQADLIAKRMPASGRFGNKHVGKHLEGMLDTTLKQLKGESPARRQLSVETYESDLKGRGQLGDATRFAAQADQSADKAQAYADSFGGQDSEAAASARQNAKYQREIAADAQDRVGRIRHEQAMDATDFGIKLKQLEVDDKAAEYGLALQGDDIAKVLTLGDQLSRLQGQLTTLKSCREQQASGLELSDAKGVADAAKADWERESASQPRLIEIKQHATGGKGGGVSPGTIEPEGYDRTFWAVPESKDAKSVSKGDDGKWYLDVDQGFGSHKKVELHPAAARRWEAKERLDLAQARASRADTAFGLDVEDLVGDPQKHIPGRLDPSRWEARAKGIGDNLAKANQDVDGARLALRMAGEHGASAETLGTLRMDLGMKLQARKHAQDEADILGLVQDWRAKDLDFRDARQPGSGRAATLTQKDLDTLRGNLREKIDAFDSSPVVLPGDMEALRKKRADDDGLLKIAEQKAHSEFQKAQKSGDYSSYYKALDAEEWVKLQIRDHDNQIRQAELGYQHTADEEVFGAMDTQGVPQMGEGGNYVSSPSRDHPAMGGDSHYLIAPPANAIEVMEGAVKQDDGSWVFQDKDGSEIKLSADKRTWTFPDTKQITERDGKFYVSFEESHGQVGESTATTGRSEERELDPAAARLWRINADQVAARADGRNVQTDMAKFRAMHAPPPPATGADGKAGPTVNFDEDLDLRLTHVNSNIGKLKDELAALPPPGVVLGAEPLRTQLEARLMLANAELRAVQAMQAWKTAEYSNLDVLGRRQAWRLDRTAVETTDTDHLDQLQATAERARSDWTQMRDRQIVAGKQQKVDDMRGLHEQWKTGHPGFTQAQEEDSGSWKNLQAAVADHKEAQRLQTSGSAGTAAEAAQQDLVRSRLRPDQYNDNGELFKLFQEEPKVMAQGLINRHYLQYGDEPITMQGRTHLGNEVGFALGWPPSRQVNAPAAASNARLNEDLFRGMSQPQRDMQKAVVDQIISLGGEHAQVTVLPVVYALDERSGIIQTGIFKVNCTDGSVKYVDEQGRSYKDLTDYRANNTLPGKGHLNMVMPEDGKFSLDDKGNVKLFVGDARTETGFETVRRVTHLDLIVGGVAVLAGAVLTVGSAGTLVAAGATLVLVGASMYGAVTSAQSLQNQAAHGQSLSWSNEQARMDWLNLGASLLAIPTLGAAGRAAQLGVEIKSATGAAKTALQANAKSLELFGKVMSVPTTAVGGYAMEEGVRSLAQNWRYMSTEEKWDQGASMLLNLVDMGSAPMLHRIGARRAAQAGLQASPPGGMPPHADGTGEAAGPGGVSRADGALGVEPLARTHGGDSDAGNSSPRNEERRSSSRRGRHGDAAGQAPIAGSAESADGSWHLTKGRKHPLAEVVNPKGSMVNCVPASVTLDRLWADPTIEVQAVPTGPWPLDVVRAMYDDPMVLAFNDPQAALRHIESLPEGSRGFLILGMNKGLQSHQINYRRVEGGGVEVVDIQAGHYIDAIDARMVFLMETHRGGTPPRDIHVLDAEQLARIQAASESTPLGGAGLPRDPPPGLQRPERSVKHLTGPEVDSPPRATPSGRQIDADLRQRTRLKPNDPLMRKLLRGLDRAGTDESRAAAELIRSGELQVNVFKRDPLGVRRDGFYVDKADYIGITVPRAWLARPQRVAGIVTHEAVHYMNRDASDPHSLDLEVQAMRAQGAVDPWHWSNRVAEDAALAELLAGPPAPGGDSVSSRSRPAGSPRFARAVAVGAGLTGVATAAGAAMSPLTTAGLDALPYINEAGVLSVVALGSLLRAAIKFYRFRQAHHWNRQHRVLTGRLQGKAQFEHLVNELTSAGRTHRPAPGQTPAPSWRLDKFNEAAQELLVMKPDSGECRIHYRKKVVDAIDKLTGAASALGLDPRQSGQRGNEMKRLAKQKASFDVTLLKHVEFVGELEKPAHGASAVDKQKIADGLAKIKAAEKLLRDGDPSNDLDAMGKLKTAAQGLDELAKALRPADSLIRKLFDGASAATYGLGLGAFVHNWAAGDIPGGTTGLALIGMLAGANVLDLVRIGGIRFDGWMRGRGSPAASVEEHWVFKKLLPLGDDGLSALAGLGLAVLAFKSGLTPDAGYGIARIAGTSIYTVTSSYQFGEGVFRRKLYRDPDKDQRPMYLNSRMLAAVGAGALVMTSAVAGLIGEAPQAQAPASQHGLKSGHPTTRLRPDTPTSGHPTTRLRPDTPIERIVTADGDQAGTAGSLWAIARSNLDWILTPQQQAAMDGQVAAEYKATQRLSRFNGFDPRLMDGRITAEPGDPDSLPEGWKVNVNVLGLTRPPTT